eukprot:CAMPEP_0173220626 /NCGR_PEP_ID=MMETSP1142-20121109/2267_1 /TAXON_ID=483371 /ORGANISM="non described non described, Strain CCMP2298" /LENGTH=79 /DNA_ID=CAMNT_0014148561 /DNA_START=100 /DNA_END=338 /DNA_ORIENTATION=-
MVASVFDSSAPPPKLSATLLLALLCAGADAVAGDVVREVLPEERGHLCAKRCQLGLEHRARISPVRIQRLHEANAARQG